MGGWGGGGILTPRITSNLLKLDGASLVVFHEIARVHEKSSRDNEDHHGGSRDVSPLDDADNGRQGTLSQQEDKDLHGAKERGQEEKVVTQ